MTPGQRHVVFSGDNLLLAAVNAQIFSGMTSARAECDVTPGISGGVISFMAFSDLLDRTPVLRLGPA